MQKWENPVRLQREVNERRQKDKQAAKIFGADAEAKAAQYLSEIGYRILAKNYRAGRGEIDLIALDDSILVFVEVRARQEEDWVGAAASITPKKKRILERSALWFWTRERQRLQQEIGIKISQIRFDALCFTGLKVFHIKGWKSGR